MDAERQVQTQSCDDRQHLPEQCADVHRLTSRCPGEYPSKTAHHRAGDAGLLEGEPTLRAQWEVHDDEALDGEEKQREGGQLLRYDHNGVHDFAGQVVLDDRVQVHHAVRYKLETVGHEAVHIRVQYM